MMGVVPNSPNDKIVSTPASTAFFGIMVVFGEWHVRIGQVETACAVSTSTWVRRIVVDENDTTGSSSPDDDDDSLLYPNIDAVPDSPGQGMDSTDGSNLVCGSGGGLFRLVPRPRSG